MSHVCSTVEGVEALLPSDRDLLGFKVWDIGFKAVWTVRLPRQSRHQSFCNRRLGKEGLHHFMVKGDSANHVG